MKSGGGFNLLRASALACLSSLTLAILLSPHPLEAASLVYDEETVIDELSPNGEDDTSEEPSPLSFYERTFSLIGWTFETFKHEEVSRSIENSSQKLDAFLGEERLFEEITNSYASLRLATQYLRGGTFKSDSKFRLRLDLPRTEHRLKLRIESEDDEFEEDTAQPQVPGERTLGDTDINASLQYIIQETRNWTVSLSPGLKVRDPIDPFVRLRLRRRVELGNWQARFVQSFEWFKTTGYGTKSTLYFERNLGKKGLLRLTSRAYRNEEEFVHRDFEVSQRIFLFYALKPRVGISTEAAIVGSTEPHWRHESYFYNVRWRRDIYKGFVFFDIKPQIDFYHDNNFHGEPSITLALEVLYGANYLQR